MQHRAPRHTGGRHRRTAALPSHRAPREPIAEKGRFAVAAVVVAGVGAAVVSAPGGNGSPAGAVPRSQSSPAVSSSAAASALGLEAPTGPGTSYVTSSGLVTGPGGFTLTDRGTDGSGTTSTTGSPGDASVTGSSLGTTSATGGSFGGGTATGGSFGGGTATGGGVAGSRSGGGSAGDGSSAVGTGWLTGFHGGAATSTGRAGGIAAPSTGVAGVAPIGGLELGDSFVPLQLKKRPPPPVAALPPGTWVNPMPEGRVTSCFGERWGRLHAGVDIAAPHGTPIRAVGAGVVVAAGAADGYGNAVLIDHGNGYLTHYAHMSTLAAQAGQRVAAGQQIGAEGSTGHSTGPHLHFEVHAGTYKNPVEPTAWMRDHGIAIPGCTPATP